MEFGGVFLLLLFVKGGAGRAGRTCRWVWMWFGQEDRWLEKLKEWRCHLLKRFQVGPVSREGWEFESGHVKFELTQYSRGSSQRAATRIWNSRVRAPSCVLIGGMLDTQAMDVKARRQDRVLGSGEGKSRDPAGGPLGVDFSLPTPQISRLGGTSLPTGPSH